MTRWPNEIVQNLARPNSMFDEYEIHIHFSVKKNPEKVVYVKFKKNGPNSENMPN
jgi:hypothetical protein